MKILFSLIALVSLVMGQFASPINSVRAQSAELSTSDEIVHKTPV